jgi:NitT/TauT family transport system permease protein
MYCAIAVMECLYLIRIIRHREQLRAASDLMVLLWGFLILWECAVTKLALMHPVLVPAPENVFQVFADDRKVIAAGVFSSLRLFLGSMIAGLAAGMAAGLICGWIRRLRDIFHPIASVLAPIPPTVFAPYVVALMPTFRSASAVVLMLGIFWPTFLGMIVRIDGMDKGIMDSARAMNLSNASMILEVLFPYAFAGVVGSLKVTFTTGIMLLTFAEMMGATSGMGYYIVNYNTYGNYTKVVAGIIVVGIVVTVFNKCIDVLQKKLIVWEM